MILVRFLLSRQLNPDTIQLVIVECSSNLLREYSDIGLNAIFNIGIPRAYKKTL